MSDSFFVVEKRRVGGLSSEVVRLLDENFDRSGSPPCHCWETSDGPVLEFLDLIGVLIFCDRPKIFFGMVRPRNRPVRSNVVGILNAVRATDREK